MTLADTIIEEARAAGLALQVEGGNIRVEPRAALTDDLRSRIIAEKPAIMAALRARDDLARHWRFHVSPKGEKPYVVCTLPMATLAEARSLWPGAAVEPLQDRDLSPTPADSRPSSKLLALVERVARAYRAPPDELAEMKRLALADPAAAWEAFTADAAAHGGR